MSQALFNQLAITVISLAKAQYSEEQFQQLNIAQLQQTIMLCVECIPLELLNDPVLLHHIADSLIHHDSVEETVMHSFMLSIYRLVDEGSEHPLERGIIKQKINGILPIFEDACLKGLIRPDIYNKNADALVAIADNAGDKLDILAALKQEYLRLQAV